MVALNSHIAFRSLASAINNPYTYTGQRDDPESLLIYYKNRYYSPDLGRFACGKWMSGKEGHQIASYSSE